MPLGVISVFPCENQLLAMESHDQELLTFEPCSLCCHLTKSHCKAQSTKQMLAPGNHLGAVAADSGWSSSTLMAWEDVTAQSKAACSPASVWGTQKVKLYRELQWVSLLPDTDFQEKKE